MMNDAGNPTDKGRKIQSVEIGFNILRCFADGSISHSQTSLTLAELSRGTGLHKSQLYRYLNTFVDLGVLIRHDEDTPSWSLGPELISLGRAASESQDVVKQAAPTMLALRDQLNETVGLSIWRERGPFFVGWEKSNKVIHVGFGIGSYVPLYTATGKIFRAFLPHETTEELYQFEVAAGRIAPEEYADDIERVRKEFIAVTESSLISGVAAVSTPIFGPMGQLVGALSILGVLGYLDVAKHGTPARELKSAAGAISRTLGYSGHS